MGPHASTTLALDRKPCGDARSYRYIRLANGVRAVVVHDPAAVFAACCVNVQAGYFDDPHHLPGLAHALEHAVHLGSAQFPEPNAYKLYLAQHGGSSNASTSMVHTQYHCRVHHNALEGALDRLGQFFVAPLLRAEAVAREMEAVHAEFSRNCNSDVRRGLQLLRSVCRPPYSLFSTGNITTLRDAPAAAGVDVAEALRSLWAQRYTAGALCAAVVAPQRLDQLEGWTVRAFGGVRADAPDDSGGGAADAGGGIGDAAPAAVALDGSRYCLDIVGPQLLGSFLEVCPLRPEMRQLQLLWHIPHGSMHQRYAKPWRWAAHLLGHEAEGSVAELLKRQGLVQELTAGVHEEVRLGRGFMWWGLDIGLTEAGLAEVEHVVATVYRGINTLQSASDEQLASSYAEAAQLASVRFDWRDRSEPLALAKAAALDLHYWAPHELLSGPALLQEADTGALRAFVARLTPCNSVCVLSSQRCKGATPLKERWYGAEYRRGPLPASLLARIHAYVEADRRVAVAAEGPPLGGESGGGAATAQLHASASDGGQRAPASSVLGEAEGGSSRVRSISLPGGVTCGDRSSGGDAGGAPSTAGAARCEGAAATQRAAAGCVRVAGELRLPAPSWALPGDLALRGVAEADWWRPPDLVRASPGMRAWHKMDTSWRIPKVHVRLHLITPLAYEGPEAVVTARLLARTLTHRLMPSAYYADLVATRYTFTAEQTGFVLTVEGLSDVVPKLLARVLDALRALDKAAVAECFPLVAGRMRQALINWRHNSPAQHAESAAEHALLLRHYSAQQLLEVLEGARVAPADVAALAARLTGSHLRCEGLTHGNATREEAAALMDLVDAALRPEGLHSCLEPRQRVLCLAPGCAPGADTPAWAAQTPQAPRGHDAVDGGGTAARTDALSALGSSPVHVTYKPVNPNPSNGNSSIFYLLQIGPEADIKTAVLLDLFVQVASRRCFHALRTVQKLGYAVSLSVHRLQGTHSAAVRIQSPHAHPQELQVRVAAWLAGFGAELRALPAAELQRHKDALQEKYTQPPESLAAAAQWAWRPIRRRHYDWTRRQVKAACVEGVSLDQLVDFFEAALVPAGQQQRRLAVHITGGVAAEPRQSSTTAAEVVVDAGQLERWRAALPAWPTDTAARHLPACIPGRGSSAARAGARAMSPHTC